MRAPGMARLLRCPNCKASVDTTAYKVGVVVKCPGCSCGMRVVDPESQAVTQMADAREVAASAPRPATTRAAAAPRGRMTPLMRKAQGARHPGGGPRKPSGTGYDRGAAARKGPEKAIMIGGGVLLLVGVIAIVALANQKDDKKKTARSDGGTNVVVSQPTPPVDDFPVVGVFQAGAKAHAGPEFDNVRIPEPAAKDDFVRRAKNKEYDALLPGVAANFSCALRAAIEDDESTARAAFGYIEFVYNQKILKAQQSKNFVKWDAFYSAKWRGGTLETIAKVWNKDHEKIVAGALGTEIDEGGDTSTTTPGDPDPDTASPIDPKEWPMIVKKIRVTAGIGPEADQRNAAMKRLRALGPKSWNGLFPYIVDEDVGVSRAVVDTLNQLAGELPDGQGRFKSDRPTDETMKNIQAQWEEWHKALK